MPDTPLVSMHAVYKAYPARAGLFDRQRSVNVAVDGVSLAIHRGESFGLVGESGCGKTTLGLMLLRLIDVTRGTIRFDDQDITRWSNRQMRPLRRRMQIIFQDPHASLDPRMQVGAIVGEPLRAQASMSSQQRRDQVVSVLNAVGLGASDLNKYPHQFSGGQRQRIAIARALSVKPALIVADEPVSALDVSIQAQVINLMMALKATFNLAYLFISHDISVVSYVCDRLAVMYAGRLVEVAPMSRFCRHQYHPYSQGLLAAVPVPDPGRQQIPHYRATENTNATALPRGCMYQPRCPHPVERCQRERPELVEIAPEHFVACWSPPDSSMFDFST